MKIKSILLGASVLAVATAAHANVTINITGATSFRGAAHQAIKNAFYSLTYAHSGTAAGETALNGASYAIFSGTFPGISGITTVRTSWSGSVEGIRAITQNDNVLFLPTSALTSGTAGWTGERYGVGNGTQGALAKMGFSDVYYYSSPYNVSGLTDYTVGVVVFTMIANKGAPANLTNVTTQQFKALFVNGSQPLSLFTGNAADTKYVYASGRNDGSGTRTTALSETGYGISNIVQQWKPVVTSGTLTSLQNWPANDGSNASVVWGNNVAGNGGFASGGSLTSALGATSAGVTLLSPSGSTIATGQDVLILSWIGVGDARTAITAGAKALSYNGVSIDPTVSGLNATDKAKVTEGAYTAWGYEHLYYNGSLSTDEDTFYNTLIASIPGNLGFSGIPVGDMNVGRTDDGAIVAP